MTPESYVKALEKHFANYADEKRAESSAKYMLNQFVYYGLTSPVRRDLSKEFIAKHGLPEDKYLEETARLLWTRKQRELQYFAMEMLEKRIRYLNESHLDLFEYMILHKSWWDTVDFIAPKLIGAVLRNKKKQIEKSTNKWRKSGNIWLMRSTLLFQLKYKSGTDTNLLFNLIAQYAEEKEFFIRKAIGWVLREHSKTDPKLIVDFVKKQKMSNLSKKEALKRII
ncbi:MAG TPA: DNA alkylation repair protein [Bacteroidia bacterium]|jgi:3-methyladenine DNA glycosylase AlkD|nr:DNA alkylation repair protein [Bacteroidia bacterium]